VVILTRPSAFDIEQATITVALCEMHAKPHAFLLNLASPAQAGAARKEFDALWAGINQLFPVKIAT